MMEFCIREQDDGSATLMTEQGHYLFTFATVESARHACREWYRLHNDELLLDEGEDSFHYQSSDPETKLR